MHINVNYDECKWLFIKFILSLVHRSTQTTIIPVHLLCVLSFVRLPFAIWATSETEKHQKQHFSSQLIENVWKPTLEQGWERERESVLRRETDEKLFIFYSCIGISSLKTSEIKSVAHHIHIYTYYKYNMRNNVECERIHKHACK